MMKKRKGSVVDILPSMIMVIAAVILITVFWLISDTQPK